jgi:hypothetical protein
MHQGPPFAVLALSPVGCRSEACHLDLSKSHVRTHDRQAEQLVFGQRLEAALQRKLSR